MVVGGGAADPEPSRPLQWGGEAALWGLIRRAVVCRPDARGSRSWNMKAQSLPDPSAPAAANLLPVSLTCQPRPPPRGPGMGPGRARYGERFRAEA